MTNEERFSKYIVVGKSTGGANTLELARDLAKEWDGTVYVRLDAVPLDDRWREIRLDGLEVCLRDLNNPDIAEDPQRRATTVNEGLRLLSRLQASTLGTTAASGAQTCVIVPQTHREGHYVDWCKTHEQPSALCSNGVFRAPTLCPDCHHNNLVDDYCAEIVESERCLKCHHDGSSMEDGYCEEFAEPSGRCGCYCDRSRACGCRCVFGASVAEAPFKPMCDDPDCWVCKRMAELHGAAEDYGWLRHRAPDDAKPVGEPMWQKLRELLDRYTMPCLGNCEHSQCPLLKELWTMMEEERIKEALDHAKETVQPIIDAEKKGEDIGDVMNMQLRDAQPSPTTDARERARGLALAVSHAWTHRKDLVVNGHTIVSTSSNPVVMLADYIEAVIIAAALSSTPAATTPSISAAIEEVEPLLSSQVAELIGLHIKGKNSDYFTTKDGLAELEAIISRHFAALALSRSIPASGARLTDEPCARCGGTGETQGYGDNNVPCGLCAGTGKRVDFVFPDTSPRATSSISAAIAEVERLRDEIDAKLAEGKGTWPESDYVRDQVWHSWGGQQYAYNKALEALRALQPSTPTTSAIEAAKELVPFLNPYFQLNRDWQERVAAIITKHCGGVK